MIPKAFQAYVEILMTRYEELDAKYDLTISKREIKLISPLMGIMQT